MSRKRNTRAKKQPISFDEYLEKYIYPLPCAYLLNGSPLYKLLQRNSDELAEKTRAQWDLLIEELGFIFYCLKEYKENKDLFPDEQRKDTP